MNKSKNNATVDDLQANESALVDSLEIDVSELEGGKGCKDTVDMSKFSNNCEGRQLIGMEEEACNKVGRGVWRSALGPEHRCEVLVNGKECGEPAWGYCDK